MRFFNAGLFRDFNVLIVIVLPQERNVMDSIFQTSGITEFFSHVEHLLTTQRSLMFRKSNIRNIYPEKYGVGTTHNLKITYLQ